MKVALTLSLLFSPPAFCAEPVCTAQQRALTKEWEQLTAYPEITDPEKTVRPGDVLVYLLPPEEGNAPDAMIALLSHKPHASLVLRNSKGELGRLESPAIMGNRFIPFGEAKLEIPYLVLRPKWQGKLAETFSSRAAFENEINRAGEILEKLKYAYDSDLVLEILNPEYRKRIKEKFDKRCLTSVDVSGQYCSELPLTALTMVGLEVTDGVPISELIPNIKNLLRYYPEKEHDSVVDKISKDFVEEMTSSNRGETKLLSLEESAVSDSLDAANRTLQDLRNDLAPKELSASVSGYVQRTNISLLKPDVVDFTKLQKAQTHHEASGALRTIIKDLQKERTRIRQTQLTKAAELLIIEQSRKVFVAALKKKLRGDRLTTTEEILFTRKIIRPHDLINLSGKDWKFEVIGISLNGMNCPTGKTRAAPTTH